MGFLIDCLAEPLGWIMRVCVKCTQNYGAAILLFTVITRILLLPVSVSLHKYSIRLVKMTPALLEIKAQYYGDKDRIAEEEAALYKQAKYNPFISFIPLLIQLFLLMGFIQVINHPMQYLFRMPQSLIEAFSACASLQTGIPAADSSIQLSAIHLLQSGGREHFAALTGAFTAQELQSALETLGSLNVHFLGIDLTLTPMLVKGATLLSPVLAALSAYLLCVVQNRANVLQAEQGRLNRWITMGLSVGLSLYLGYFVPLAVALYWIASNCIAVLTQYLLNAWIPPQKEIDYDALEAAKKRLAALETSEKQASKDKNLVRREKEDIRRLNHVANKHIVFYSESSGFYKYYRSLIEALLKKSNVIVHYITSDPNDQIFEIARENGRIRAYYVGQYRLITLMMRIEADVIVMTMPDLENYQIKRSYIKKDIEYVYVPHCIDSLNMTMRKGSVDHFDTVFCVGPHHRREIEQTEQVYGLPKKKLIDWGYGLLDDMRAAYARETHEKHEKPEILIAPSWQKDNIIESCLDPLLTALSKLDVHITVRPHPQAVRLKPALMQEIAAKWQSGKVCVQTDFSSNSTVFDADLMITDWSGITFEYTFTTYRPVLYIDTPMKVMNPEYRKIPEEPINITLRNSTGISIRPEEAGGADRIVRKMLDQMDEWHDRIEKLAEQYIYHPGCSGEVGAAYLIQTLKEIQRRNKEEDK